MRPRSFTPPGRVSGNEGLTVVALSGGHAKHFQSAEDVLIEDGGTMISYSRFEDLAASPPAFDPDMAVLSTDGHPDETRHVLGCMSRLWPEALLVVTSTGGAGAEQAARECGALFFSTPVSSEQWYDISRAALRVRDLKRAG